MPFNFPRPTFDPNSGSAIFKGKGVLPSVGVNFGAAGRLAGLFFGNKGGGIRKGHPGTGVYTTDGPVPKYPALQKVANALFPRSSTTLVIDVKRWEYRKENGGAEREYPAGFTPPHAFRSTNELSWAEVEEKSSKIAKILRGSQPNIPEKLIETSSSSINPDIFENITLLDIKSTLEHRKNILDKIDPRTRNFTFGLKDETEYLQIFQQFKTTSDSGQELYAGLQGYPVVSFTEVQENEDPTILGFDIIIDEITSPLFNGACKGFIEDFKTYSVEIESRGTIYTDFVEQFKRFFQMNTAKKPTTKLKNYYINQIKGVEGWNHMRGKSSGSSEGTGPSRFVKFPTEKITLMMNEDVEQNFSYLSYLWNILTWSRIEGKQLIPDNVLRFNAKVIISEIRNYNRVIEVTQEKGPSASPPYQIVNDLISKREYNLYECKFYFPSHGFPSGEGISIGGSENRSTPLGSQTIEFDYKFVSSEFHRFKFIPANIKKVEEGFSYSRYSDEQFDPKKLTSYDTNRAVISEGNNQGFSQSSFISLLDPIPEVFIKDTIPAKRIDFLGPSDLTALKKGAQSKNFLKDLGKNLLRGVAQAGANAINRELSKKFKNINKALDNLRNSNPLTSRMGPPKNIYRKESRLKNEIIGNLRSALGPKNLRGAPGGGGETGIGPSPFRPGGSVQRIDNPNNIYPASGLNSQIGRFLGPSVRPFFRN